MSGAGQAVIAETRGRSVVKPAFDPDPPAPAGPGQRRWRAQIDQIAAFVEDPGPVPGLAGRDAFDPDRLAGPVMADLALRAIEHHVELVLAELQFDIGEFVAPVAAIGLIGPQHAVAVQFGIPAGRQSAAQRGGSESRGQVERAVGNEGAAAIGALRGKRAGRGIDIAEGQLGRAQRPQHPTRRIVAIGLEPDRIRRERILPGNPRGIAHAEHLAAGEDFVTGAEPAVPRPLRLGLDIDRGRAPGLIGRLGLGQGGKVEFAGGRLAKSRRATFALDRLEERQLAIGFDHDRHVAEVRAEPHPHPARQRRQAHAPAFGGVVDRVGTDRPTSVHGLYRIRIAIDHQPLILCEDPASCAARLLVEPHRQIERLDQVGKIDADPARGLIAAQRFAQFVLAGMQLEQQRIIVIGGPAFGLGRHRPNGKNRPDEGGKLAQGGGPAGHDVSFSGNSLVRSST